MCRESPTFRRAPKRTAYERDLYSLTKPVSAGMSRDVLEEYLFKLIDNYAARVRDKMLREGLKSLSIEEACDWARFLMSLRVRQPDIFSKIVMESAEHLRRTLGREPEQYEALALEGDAPTLEEWTEQRFPGLIENFGKSLIRDLVDNGEDGTKLLRLRWWLWDFAGGKHELLLSDNPCLFTGPPRVLPTLPESRGITESLAI